ncbi:glycerate kinase [Bogoriella caseilytica]|uniref:Glycerate kinase n=2 Tax=Bogoriella caseilytica TaxID=56055 RepID=A0A3N2B9R6_9MICO|nr:glycerate kinase [Bogoriella caseilytica]
MTMQTGNEASPKKILLALDKFKGSLTAAEAADHVAIGLRRVLPGVTIASVPVADGGEGTVEAALRAGLGEVRLMATGPLGERRETRYAADAETAVIEMAEISGLQMLEPTAQTSLSATSRGVGDAIAHALDTGRRRIIIGVGGSASTDGGAGMLAALGLRLLGPSGALPDGGAALGDLVEVDASDLHAGLSDAELILAADVDNPLLGPSGAAQVYGPQKGADPQSVERLEAGLAQWAAVLGRALPEQAQGRDELAGAGAAGGVGYACLVLGARFQAGVALMLELAGFDEHVRDVDLVITGEGSLDAQSLHGKVPVGVAQAAAQHGVPTIALAGRSLISAAEAVSAGIESVHTLVELEPDPAICMAQAGPLLETLAEGAVAS